MSVVAVFNQKGGVGKTTTTLNLIAALARRGKFPLGIDLDPQSHLTLASGVRNLPFIAVRVAMAGLTSVDWWGRTSGGRRRQDASC